MPRAMLNKLREKKENAGVSPHGVFISSSTIEPAQFVEVDVTAREYNMRFGDSGIHRVGLDKLV